MATSKNNSRSCWGPHICCRPIDNRTGRPTSYMFHLTCWEYSHVVHPVRDRPWPGHGNSLRTDSKGLAKSKLTKYFFLICYCFLGRSVHAHGYKMTSTDNPVVLSIKVKYQQHMDYRGLQYTDVACLCSGSS